MPSGIYKRTKKRGGWKLLEKTKEKMRGRIPWNKGKTKEKYPQLKGNITKGRIPWNKNKKGYTTSHKGYKHSKKTKQKIKETTLKRNYHHSETIKEKIREASLERWKNKDIRKKIIKAVFKGLKLKPNKPEKLLAKLLNKLLPNKYKYTGNGYTFIGGFVPDFVDFKNKKIIELFGDYWHNIEKVKIRDKQRLKTYKKYEYNTLIIWQHELEDLNRLKQKLLKFQRRI